MHVTPSHESVALNWLVHRIYASLMILIYSISNQKIAVVYLIKEAEWGKWY